jgi:hypothetical protein
MALQLWIGHGGGYFFLDTSLGVKVGQAFQEADSSWRVEVNDEYFTVPDIEQAKRFFVERYDPSLIQTGPASSLDPHELEELAVGFSIIDLGALEKS